LRGWLSRLPFRHVLPVVLVLEAAAVFSRGLKWSGHWFWTIDWAGAAFLLIGPLLAGVAAWHVRYQARVFGEWESPSRGALRSTTAVLVADAVAFALVHVLVLGLVSGITALRSPLPPLETLHGLVHFGVLFGYVGVGYLVGVYWNSPYAAPTVALASFLAPISGFLPHQWFEFGGSTGNLSGYAPDWFFDLALGLGYLSIFVAAASISRLVRLPSSWSRVAAFVAAAGVGISSFAYLARHEEPRFVLKPTVSVCTPRGELTICLNSDVEFALGPVADLIQRMNAELQEIGVQRLPKKYVQITPGDPSAANREPGTRHFALHQDALRGGGDWPLVLAGYLVADADCEAGALASRDSSLSLDIAAHVLVVRTEGGAEIAAIPEVATVLSADASVAQGWLRSVLQAANDCRIDKIPPPLTGGTE
jgi:hypothetical protein